MDIAKHRFTVEEYHLMGEAGIFGEDDRVELVAGEIIEMTPVGWRHAQTVNNLNHLLVERAVGRYAVSVQNPLVLDEHDERLPDLTLLREQVKGRLPETRDALLVVEVSDSSLRYDRETKLPIYARVAVPEVWVVNLQEEQVEVYDEPGPDGYDTVRYARGDEEVGSSVVGGILAAQILA